MIQLHHHGWHSEHQFYLMGDCIVADCERGKPGYFIFPDFEGKFLFEGKIFIKSENLSGIEGPRLFPGSQSPAQEYGRIHWNRERWVVEEIFTEVIADFRRILTHGAAEAAVASTLQYLILPEAMNLFGCKPGLWITGRKGTGKTTAVRNLMRILGDSQTYTTIARSTTATGLRRTLESTCNLPVHFDEWRNLHGNAIDLREHIVRDAYNETKTAKGSPDAGSAISHGTPLTVPIITGEDITTDPALRSRYLIIEITPSPRTADDHARHLEAIERASHYHRLGRYLLRQRPDFARAFNRACEEIIFQVPRAGSRTATHALILLATMHAAYQVIFKDNNAFNRDRVIGTLHEWLAARILEQDSDAA